MAINMKKRDPVYERRRKWRLNAMDARALDALALDYRCSRDGAAQLHGGGDSDDARSMSSDARSSASGLTGDLPGDETGQGVLL